jgi:hypothetical protein
LDFFPHRERRRRSHGHRTYTRPTIHDVTFDSLLPYVNRKLGPHHIRTKLYSVPLKTLNTLFEQARDSPYLDFSTAEYRLNYMIMDIAHHKLFKPPKIMDISPNLAASFFKLKFYNRGIDAVNLSNIFRHKKVRSRNPEYFKSKSTPCISYTCTPTIACKLFNYKQTLQSLNIHHLTLNPPTCSCSSPSFNYSPAGHIITGDVDIVENEVLKSLIRKGPKFREPRSLIWRQNFVSIVNAVEDYAKRWAKRENEELDTLS